MRHSSPIIAPSLFAASADHFSRAIACVERAGAEYLHIDVMNGHFVPNLSFGPNIVSGIRACSRLFFDVHLMLEHPLRLIEAFIAAGADGITIHPEAKSDVSEVLAVCREHNVRFGLALKPETPLESVERYLHACDLLLIMSIQPGFGGQRFMPAALTRIQAARELRARLDAPYRISVDGGINAETGAQCVSAGADILVAGSAIFEADDPAAAIASLKGKRTV